MAAALPWAISNANRGVTFVHTRFWTTLNSGSFDLIEHFHRMLVTAPAADLGRFTAIRFRSARLRQNWEFARHTFVGQIGPAKEGHRGHMAPRRIRKRYVADLLHRHNVSACVRI